MPISNRDAGSAAPRALRAVVLLAVLCGLGGALGGCASGGAAGNAFASAGGGATVAFESIDGPPPQVFDRMVNLLDSESKLRNVAIVSREGSAAVPHPKLSGGAGQPRPHHHRLGVGRLRPRPAARDSPLRRGTGRQGRTRRLGRRRRRGVAANRTGGPDRPGRHDQRNGAGGRAGCPAGAAARDRRLRGWTCRQPSGAFSVSTLSYSAR